MSGKKPGVLAYFLNNFSPFAIRITGDFGIRWYGLSYVAAFAVAFYLYRTLVRRGLADMPEEKVGDFITMSALFGVLVGGRIGWIFFYGWPEVLVDWRAAFTVWKGGMASHGGMIGLIFVTLWFSRRHKVSWTGIGDSLCVVAAAGIFLVRIANFVNGELYGKPTQSQWAMQFASELRDDPALAEKAGAHSPEAVEALIAAARSDVQLADRLREVLTPRHASQLYEAALEGVLLFAVLWLLRTRVRLPRGALTGWFFILYAVARIVCEMYREPDRSFTPPLGLSPGQFLSLFLIVIGAGFLAWSRATREYERAWRVDAPAK